MSKVAHYLQEHVMGEVMTSADARHYFATDGSIFAVTPAVVIYPRNENDVRKTARFTWQLAERGRIIPITARGSGSDQSGAAIGPGIIMAFPAHMNRILELDSKSGVVVAEPGINYGTLQQTLQTHGRFLPPFPASLEFSTIASTATSYSLSNTDDVIEATSSGIAITLHNAVTATVKVYKLQNSSSGNISFATTGGQTVNGSTTGAIIPGQALDVIPNGSNWIIG